MSDSPWYPLQDDAFWNDLNRIEDIGRRQDRTGAQYLASFVLVDDLGPLGRAMFLAKAAVAAFSQMPDAAATVLANSSVDPAVPPSYYQKIGYCKLAQIAGDANAPHLSILQHDSDERIRSRVARIYAAIKSRVSGS